jgi:hypothetical protein
MGGKKDGTRKKNGEERGAIIEGRGRYIEQNSLNIV